MRAIGDEEERSYAHIIWHPVGDLRIAEATGRATVGLTLGGPVDTICSLPVYSRLSTLSLPSAPYPLYQHQRQTLDATNDPDVDVVINTAITGDGKSLAAFLPATPLPELGSMLQKAGLRVVHVSGEYAHDDAGAGWRRILAPATISFDSLGPAQTVEGWAEEHLQDSLLDFYRRNPRSRGALIVNSVAAARRLVALLRPPFADAGLSVHENTGLSPRAERLRSRDADLLVGTSTIDVGVDFRINFLVFESVDAATFLQRFGRLGRHTGYIDADGQEVAFREFQAVALVSPFVRERLFSPQEGSPPPLRPDDTVDRLHLRNLIEEAYPETRTFPRYAERWGCYLAAHVVNRLGEFKVAPVYREMLDELTPRYEQVYGVKMAAKVSKLRRWRRDVPALEAEIRSFRGSSPFMSAVVEETGTDMSEWFHTYDLLRLAGQFGLEYLDWRSFDELVPRGDLDPALYDHRELLCTVRVTGVSAARRPLKFWIDADVGDLGGGTESGLLGWNRAHVLPGIELATDVGTWTNEVNRRLRSRRLVCVVVPKSPAELRRWLPPARRRPPPRLHRADGAQYDPPPRLLPALPGARRRG